MEFILPSVPRHAFGAFYPSHAPPLPQIALQPMTVPDAPRNCIPSLHLAGALAVWWNSRRWLRWARLLAGLFLAATVFSTLALGEHYLVDLVVAVPFTLAFQAAWTVTLPLKNSARRRALATGAILTVAWFVGLRYGLSPFVLSPAVSWSLVLLTLGCCLALEHHLSAARSNPRIRGARTAAARALAPRPGR